MWSLGTVTLRQRDLFINMHDLDEMSRLDGRSQTYLMEDAVDWATVRTSGHCEWWFHPCGIFAPRVTFYNGISTSSGNVHPSQVLPC